MPELWRYGKQGLQISVLQDGKYVESDASPTFPDLPIVELIDRYVQQSQTVGSSQELDLLNSGCKIIFNYLNPILIIINGGNYTYYDE